MEHVGQVDGHVSGVLAADPVQERRQGIVLGLGRLLDMQPAQADKLVGETVDVG